MKYIIFSPKHIFTTANTFSIVAIIFWFFSIFLILEQRYQFAFNLILVWVLCDILDGYFARKTQTVSEIGALFDTVCDIFLYVLSPVFLIYSLFQIDFIWFIVLVLFLLAAIIRLIVFSTGWFHVITWKLYYLWLPVYFHLILFQIILHWTYLHGLYILLLLLSILMIVRIPFRKYGLTVSILYVGGLFLFHNLPYLW